MFFVLQHIGAILLAVGFSVPAPPATRPSYRELVLADHPIAYWRLHDDCPDRIVHDETDHHLDGTCNPVGVCTTQCSLHNIGDTAVAFDGSGGAVDLGNPDALDLKHGNLSIETWVKVQLPLKAAENIVAHGCPDKGNAGQIVLRICDGDYSGGVWDGRPHFASCTVPAEDNDKWVHLVLTYNGTDWLLYRNGKEFARTTDAVGPIHIPTGWKIGAGAIDGDQNFFHGEICDVAIYDSALTPEQIHAHYCAGSNGGSGQWSVVGGQLKIADQHKQ